MWKLIFLQTCATFARKHREGCVNIQEMLKHGHETDTRGGENDGHHVCLVRAFSLFNYE